MAICDGAVVTGMEKKKYTPITHTHSCSEVITIIDSPTSRAATYYWFPEMGMGQSTRTNACVSNVMKLL